ncbi:alcohol dehydrogenase [Paenibacillus baekrokdamisoli]|uniref:Alcohol dehydrogenase n=1 Tax=Paenibacillus baekrokdamisoli TaxID=1712516 RepID=A0A3G9IT38_9BACL|nr:zinc-binding alcohol dehydrogenase family protein [Paenibacillus baekrokdamisoli]MBB3070421.1 2-desacetyl-2-hydroxyethyl bacteriochlorophyllide A dehydrogenase [Paenibacillus baekrokdamisoli]BBH21422.1 alcohol dehydrogenase [Paenibacillus baekrokdamisoli]
MKGIVCEQIDQFQYIEMLEPTYVKGEAIVRIKRIGICGTDLHAYKGNQPFFTYPRVLGHELAGIIEQVGENEAGLQVGDQVSIIPYMHCGSCIACLRGKTNCCTDMKVLGVHVDGGMRELISVPTSHLILTNGLTLDQTAVLEPLSIGAHAVRRSGLQKGETVLVIGAGPIGLGVMAFAKQSGAKVIVMDMKDERLDFCRQWANVDHTINALHGPKEQLAAIQDGELPTVVFDATGNARSMMDAFQYAAHGGVLVYVGLVKADISFHDPEFHKRELTLMASRNATREDFDNVLMLMKNSKIDVEQYVTHRVPFEMMISEFDRWLMPESKVIKALVEL